MKNEKKSNSIVETCEKVFKIALYALTFLLPIFFLPWTANVLDFNKQALLFVFVLIALFAWMLKVLVSGRLSFNLSFVNIAVAVLFLIYLVSTIFSWWRYGSFWGWPQISSESLLSLLGLVLFYFLVINIFEKKEIFHLITLLIASAVLALVYGILQTFGKFIIPISFTKNLSFNTIGGTNGLAVFAAVLLPLIIICLISSREKYFRILFAAAAFVCGLALLLFNFQPAWWLVVVGSALLIVFATQRRDIFDSRWLVLPMFFLGLALLFVFFKFQIPGLPDAPLEIFLRQKVSFNIAWQALKESPLLGSGPGTFIYDFSKYKDISFNNSSFWNVNFDWAGSRILTVLATIGVLGILGFLALLGFFLFFGLKFLAGQPGISQVAEENEFSGQRLFSIGIFISFITLNVAYFLYGSNLSLDFVYFVLLAGFVVLISGAKKKFLLKPSSFLTLGVTFGFTLIFIFGLGLLILEGQRYVSSVSYLRGTAFWQQGQSEQALNEIERAVRISPAVDFYWRELAQIYLQNIQDTSQRTDLSKEEINQLLQIYVNKTVNSAKTASEVNPKNVANWSVLGFIYQNLIGLVSGTKDWAVSSYDQAQQLEPSSPYYPTQAGIAILKEANLLSEDKKEEKATLFSQAEEKFRKALELKSDYAAAHFQLAMVYQSQAKQEQMVEELEKTKAIAPADVGLAFQLGIIYFQMQDFEKARIELERAVILSPDYANALYFLALTYDELKEKEKAVAAIEKVLELNPSHPIASQVLENLKSGQKALKGLVEEQPPVAPIEEEHPEIEE